MLLVLTWHSTLTSALHVTVQHAAVATPPPPTPKVFGKNGVGSCNSNGTLQLLITNSVFRLPKRNRTSWVEPRSKHWHLLDYVIVRQRDRQDVPVTKAMRRRVLD